MVFSRELPHSFADALRVCREILSADQELVRKNLIDTEAEQLVIGAHRLATGEFLSRAQFLTRIQDRLPETSAERLLILAGMRAEGVPLQHILGWQAFLEHEYKVNSSTLIPRPETEVLVMETIQSLSFPKRGFEIGIGTGVISIELLSRFHELQMVASEISEDARQLAEANARNILGSMDRLAILKPADGSDVLGVFTGTADFIVSNPPYLDAASSDETETEVLAHEPKSALFPEGGDPLHFYKQIAAHVVGEGVAQRCKDLRRSELLRPLFTT